MSGVNLLILHLAELNTASMFYLIDTTLRWVQFICIAVGIKTPDTFQGLRESDQHVVRTMSYCHIIWLSFIFAFSLNVSPYFYLVQNSMQF